MSEDGGPAMLMPGRAVRIVVGAVTVVALLGALGWMLPRFIAQPERASLTQETPAGAYCGYGHHHKAEEIVEVPFGETVVLDDLTEGTRYSLETSSYLQGEWATMEESEKKEWMESEGWDEELAPFSARVVDCAMVSPSAFTEWCPLYFETDLSAVTGTLFDDKDVRIVVVSVEATNLGTKSMAPPNPLLRCAAFAGNHEMMDVGMLPDSYAQAALYPRDGGDFAVGLAENFDTVLPGETRVIRYAFVIYRNSFAEKGDIDNADLSAMEIAYLDCNPWRIIALKLANARDAVQMPSHNAHTDGILGR